MLTKLLPFALAGALTVPAFAADLSVIKTAYEAPSAVVQTDTSDALSSSSSQYAIQINGEVLDATACIMVPLRAVAEPLGFSVTWNRDFRRCGRRAKPTGSGLGCGGHLFCFATAKKAAAFSRSGPGCRKRVRMFPD